MRVWGYVLIAVGALFAVLLALAAYGGGQIGFVPFLVCFFLIMIGVSFAKSGTGLAAAAPSVSASTTQEIPMSPAIAAAIGAQTSGTWRRILYIVIGCVAALVLIGALLAAFDNTPGEGMQIFAFLAGIAVLTGGMILLISWLTAGRQMLADSRAATFLRTTGPLQLVPVFGGGAMLRLADQAFLLNGRTGVAELGKLSGGTVDYTSRAHILLAAWDSDGRRVFATPGYDAPALLS